MLPHWRQSNMVPRNSIQLLNINTTKFQVEREPVSVNYIELQFSILVDAEQEILKLGLQFTIEPTDTIAVRGQSAVLNCYGNSTTGSGPVTVSWLKDRKGIHADGRINLLSNGSLYISRVQRKRRYDEGDYECRLQNNIGSILSKPAKLRIASK